MNVELEFCLYKLFEIIGVIAVSGIYILSVFLGNELKNALIYNFSKIFLSLVVFKFLYVLNLEKEVVSKSEGVQVVVFLNLLSKFLIIYALIFSVLCRERLKEFLSKASIWINITLIIVVFLISEKIKNAKINILLQSTLSTTKLYFISELLIVFGILFLIYLSFYNSYFKQNNSFKVFVLAFAVGELILSLFKRKGILFTEAVQNGAMLYLFVAIFLAIAKQRVKFLHSLAKFSTEVLKEKLDLQKSFELLVDFIYEAYSKVFPRICFYYIIEDGNYKLIVFKSEEVSDKFEDSSAEVKVVSKLLEEENISTFDIKDFENFFECKALKNRVFNSFQTVVYVPVHRYNRLVGFLICYSKIKNFNITGELQDGFTIFMNFSQALLSQIERIEKIKNLSTEDELTGLYNRRYFMKELILESIAADRYKNKFCVAFFDMDNLKLLNDVYGHGVGDKAIKIIARIIRDNIRKTDIAARLGGDEFAVIFKNCSKDAIEDRIKNIKQLIEKESELQLPKKIRVSCGIAVYPDDTTSLDELIKIADMRMYEEKLKNKGGDFDAERQ